MDNNPASSSQMASDSAKSVSIDIEGGKAASDESALTAPLPKIKVGQSIVEPNGKANNHVDHKPTLGSSNSVPGSRASRGNILSSLLARQRSTPASSSTAVNRRVQQSGNGEDPSGGGSTWRMHLNEMFSVSTPPSNEALLSIIQRSNLRYQSLTARGENQETSGNPSMLEDIALRDGNGVQAQPNSNNTTSPTLVGNSFNDEGAPPAAPNPNGGDSSNHEQNDGQDDRDAVWFITKIWPYLPILLLLLAKFCYDHFMGILNLSLLQFVMLILNESVRREMLKFIRESIGKLITLFLLCGIVIALCLCLAEAPPDPFGLILPPPTIYESRQRFTSALKSEFGVYEPKNNYPAESLIVENFENTPIAVDDQTKEPNEGKLKEVSVTIKETLESKEGKTNDSEITTVETEEKKIDEKSNMNRGKPDLRMKETVVLKVHGLERSNVSLGALLFYTAVSDLVLRIITILIKCLETMLLRKSIRKKRLLRIFVFTEYLSQFYRCLTPYTQWMLYLYGSYTKDEDIVRIALCCLYTFIKISEVCQRGAALKKATQSVLSKIDPERIPTKEELDGAGTDCPICHDTYNSPIIVECGHIFCEDCVQTWFTREQTCPMCRAKVNDDPAFQDGGTTYTFQLY